MSNKEANFWTHSSTDYKLLLSGKGTGQRLSEGQIRNLKHVSVFTTSTGLELASGYTYKGEQRYKSIDSTYWSDNTVCGKEKMSLIQYLNVKGIVVKDNIANTSSLKSSDFSLNPELWGKAHVALATSPSLKRIHSNDVEEPPAKRQRIDDPQLEKVVKSIKEKLEQEKMVMSKLQEEAKQQARTIQKVKETLKEEVLKGVQITQKLKAQELELNKWEGINKSAMEA